MEIVVKGVVSGFALALLIGPVFFTIIQTSIEQGFWKGVLVAAGVSLSDSLYITLAYLGLIQALDNGDTQVYMAYAGGLILFVFGAYYLFVKSRRVLNFQTVNVKARSPLRLIAKGFIINGLSPMVLIFWIGIVSAVTGEFGDSPTSLALTFFGSMVATVFITDLIKAKLADRLRQLLTPKFIRVMNIVLGVVMVIFGARLLLFADQIHFV